MCWGVMVIATKVQYKMRRSYLKTTEFFVLVLWLGCATGRSDGNGTNTKRNQDFFLKQIFDKYGDHGVITFEVKKKTSSDVRTDNSYIRFVEGAGSWSGSGGLDGVGSG